MCLENCFTKFLQILQNHIYIDGNNVAYSRFNKLEKPMLCDILALIEYLVKVIGFRREKIQCICDIHSLFYLVILNNFLFINDKKLGLKTMNTIKKLCQEQDLDYYKTLLFVEQQLRAKEVLLRRELNKIEISKEIDMALTYLSQFGEREGLKTNYRDKKENDDNEGELSTLDVLNIIQDKKGELDLF